MGFAGRHVGALSQWSLHCRLDQQVCLHVLITAPVGAVAKYCDEYVCVLCVCLSVCLRGYLQKHIHDLYQLFCACFLCLWPSPPLAG